MTFIFAPAEWLAQVTGGSDLTGVIGLIGQLGISAVFIWLYYNERKERQAVQQTLNQFLEKFGALVPETARTLEDVKRGMDLQVERTIVPMRRLEQVVDDLDALTRRRRNEPQSN